ncbi:MULTISPECIES: galactose-binding domain-containing protein [Streptomyces]|uniref:galactose-binding domain-containing protein n=1 Tax=Streptomyces TaxID=1883 RepID=UPI0031F005A4
MDGLPTNEPFWGAGGSPNSQDWYELNFGTTRTLIEVRLYFKDSRPASTTYRAPSSYSVQYHNGTSWVNAEGQTKSPAAPRANYNLVRFPAISAQRIRVLATNASGAKTGLTEIKVHHRGGAQPPANLATSATASASHTSSWESVTAINDGVDPPSSNDTVNPRWGTWPETGQQWAELTWPSAKSVGRAEVYFFDDDQGIDMPASWKLQYWNGSAYVDVPGASGYPVAKNQYNAVTFTATNTTRLRVQLTSNGSNSVGLLEAKVYGP